MFGSKGIHASSKHDAVGVSDGRLCERMRAVVFYENLSVGDISKSLKGSNPRDVWKFA